MDQGAVQVRDRQTSDSYLRLPSIVTPNSSFGRIHRDSFQSDNDMMNIGSTPSQVRPPVATQLWQSYSGCNAPVWNGIYTS